MSVLLDDPLRAAQDAQHARLRQDVSRVSRKELEDSFLQLYDDSLLLKQHIHQQEDKIRKLGTKLLRLVKDRRRMEQLAGGGAPSESARRLGDKDDLVDEFQEKVRALEADNDKLKRRLLAVKRRQRLAAPSPAAGRSPRVRARPASAPGKRDDASSPSPTPPRRARSSAGDEPAASMRALLEETREKSRNLENVMEWQRHRIAQLEEEKHVTLQQQNKSELRSQINNNVTMIKLQKQLAERCNAMLELEERFLQLQESQHMQKACYEAAAAKMGELTSQLRDERAKSVELRARLRTEQLAHAKLRQLQEHVDELEQEKELLKEHNEKLLAGMLDGSQQRRNGEQLLQLQQHAAQLEAALQADLRDKKLLLEQVQAERDARDQLTEEKRQLELRLAQQKRETEELGRRPDARGGARESQRGGRLSEPREGPGGGADAHAETIHELEKVRQLLAAESRISADLKAELESVRKKMERDESWHAQQLERQEQAAAAKDAKLHKVEALLRDAAYGAKGARAPDPGTRDASTPLEDGENLVEVQMVGATLSAAALEALGDPAPSTFCTYAFYLFELHATPVAAGAAPRYGFTSRYVVSVDRDFLEYLGQGRLCVEMHQALGLRWKTVAGAALDLRRLLRDGATVGTAPLIGSDGEDASFGSLEYWIRLRHPIAESERPAAVGGPDEQVPPGPEKELLVEVRGCDGLRSGRGSPPSPYVVYKLFGFPDHPTSTVHRCGRPRFADVKSFRVVADGALERYLASEALGLYVFDGEEPRMDQYLGKALVPLAPLLRDQEIAGTFDLHDSAGHPAGHIDLALKWKLPSLQRGKVRPRNQAETARGPASAESHGDPLTLAKKLAGKDEQLVKKVTFREAAPPDLQEAPAARLRPAEEDEDDEESLISEGQLLLPPAAFPSDPGDPRSPPGERDATAFGRPPRPRALNASLSAADSDGEDDGVVHPRPAQGGRRVRVEVTCLSLEAESRLCSDASVVRLFVEFSFLDMRAQETPVSLPKPPPGKSVSFNFSRVFAVDAAGGASRRKLLKDVLRGRKPDMERIRFTVVSDPPEEEEQERDCEDVGVAFLTIPDLLRHADDVAQLDLAVLDAKDGVSRVGSLRVSFEGVDTLRAILRESDGEPGVAPSGLR